MFTRDEPYQIFLNLLRRFRRGDPQSIAQARHMRIHHNAFIDAKGISENYVGRLAPHTGQRHQLWHGLRYFAMMLVH